MQGTATVLLDRITVSILVHFLTFCVYQVGAVSPERAAKLPLYEDVVVLTHRHEWNIYHWTVETVRGWHGMFGCGWYSHRGVG